MGGVGVGIVGVGSYLPEQIVTNKDLEKIVNTSDEWIRTRTGIEERRIATDEIDTSHMAIEAGKRAIAHSGLKPNEIDMIIVATAAPDYAFPSVACLVQQALEIPNIPAMDVSAACSGFIYALITAKQFIKTKAYKHILVIGSEKFSKLLDWDDRNSCVLFGDGAGAVVVSEVSAGKGILSFELGADGSGWEHLFVDEEEKFVKMNGREVFKFAVRQMPQSSMSVIEKANIAKEDVHYLIPHQANLRIIDAARKRLRLPEEQVAKTVRQHGNTSAASIPLALAEAVENEQISDGDIVVLIGFGGGLTWGAACLRWGK